LTFGSTAEMAEAEEEVASSYAAELEELTFNSKPIINSLTMIAEELLPHASVLVKVIEDKIRSAPPDRKLPTVYLMDSIVKNIGGAYKKQFAASVAELLGATYDVATPKVMTSLKNLAKTWDDIFPADVMQRVNARIGGGAAAAGAATAAPPAQSAPAGGSAAAAQAASAASRKRARGATAAAAGGEPAARSELQSLVQRVHAHVQAGLAADSQLMDLISRSVTMYRQLLSTQPQGSGREQLSAQLWEMQRLQAPPPPTLLPPPLPPPSTPPPNPPPPPAFVAGLAPPPAISCLCGYLGPALAPLPLQLTHPPPFTTTISSPSPRQESQGRQLQQEQQHMPARPPPSRASQPPPPPPPRAPPPPPPLPAAPAASVAPAPAAPPPPAPVNVCALFASLAAAGVLPGTAPAAAAGARGPPPPPLQPQQPARLPLVPTNSGANMPAWAQSGGSELTSSMLVPPPERGGWEPRHVRRQLKGKVKGAAPPSRRHHHRHRIAYTRTRTRDRPCPRPRCRPPIASPTCRHAGGTCHKRSGSVMSTPMQTTRRPPSLTRCRRRRVPPLPPTVRRVAARRAAAAAARRAARRQCCACRRAAARRAARSAARSSRCGGTTRPRSGCCSTRWPGWGGGSRTAGASRERGPS
jgi:hypothetical protein